MTMLDRMRRHKGWLKWSLVLVCLAFVFFYIPDFFEEPGTAAPGDVVAEVEGRRITAGQFQRLYQTQLQAYRSAYGDAVSDQLLRQMGIEQQLLQQMIDEQAALAEADRLGIRATDAEVRERIITLPAFQENGQFFGEARYRQLLRMQRPPLTPAEFEEAMRQSIVLDKLRAALTDWITISDAEVEREYRHRHEQVQFELVALTPDQFRDAVEVDDAALMAHFEANREDYRVPEKRSIRYLSVDVEALRATLEIPDAEIERYYNDNIGQFSTPEQVRASHILLSTEGRDEAAVRQQAEEILEKARAGADFAELARQYSEDPGSAAEGGDLDFFGRGRMVPEFEQAAFAAEPDTITDLVQTQYGFHIIYVTDKQPASTQPLEEVRDQISDQLKWEQAQIQADNMARALEIEIREPGDLDRVAAARGLAVQETEPFAAFDPIPGLGPAPEVSARAFELEEGHVSNALRTPPGFAFIHVTGRHESYLPELEEVRDRVREDVVREKAAEAARARATEIAPILREARDFAAAAKAAGLEVHTTELITRGSPLPGIGIRPAIERVVFSLPEGAVSEPLEDNDTTAIVRVVAREDISPEAFAAEQEDLRAELLAMRQGRFFSAYMAKAKERMTIEIRPAVLARVTAI